MRFRGWPPTDENCLEEDLVVPAVARRQWLDEQGLHPSVRGVEQPRSWLSQDQHREIVSKLPADVRERSSNDEEWRRDDTPRDV